MNTSKDKNIVYLLMAFLFIGLMGINFANQGSPGGADSYVHYLIARWSFMHPELLFDHWGKPIFTILSAPFAQFGFKGSVTFNIISAIISGYLVYKSAKLLHIKNPWLGLLFTVFTPIFFYITFSSLTEIIFALVLTLSIYLFIRKDFIWSAIIISFIPFARSEGVIFIPLFIIAFASLKKFRTIPYLISGFLVMSLAGYPFHQDLLWVINKSPYHDTSALYGSGDIFHFIDYSPALIGWPLIILFFLGVVASILTIIKSGRNHKSVVLFLLLTTSLGYFAAHSVVWAFGMGGSLGLTRVIAGIAPTVALVALIGYNAIQEKVTSPIANTVLAIVIGLIVVIDGATRHEYPIQLGVEEKVIVVATDYIKEQNLDTNFIVYYHPAEAFLLDLDKFSSENSISSVRDRADPSKDLPLGTIIIWDGHFGPNEGGLPKQVLEDHSDFIRIKDFQPEYPFKVYNGQDFEVIIYQKIIH